MRALLSRVVLAAALAAPLGPGRAFAEDAAAEAAELLARAEYGEVEKVLGRVAKKEQAALLRAELLLRTGKLDDAERATLAAEKDGKLEVCAARSSERGGSSPTRRRPCARSRGSPRRTARGSSSASS
jgi:hypothetical protein